MKKKIYGYFTGGLGNQLFQYCAYKNIAINNKAELIIDPISGFTTDFLYKRTFLLNKLRLQNVRYKNNFLIFTLIRFMKKFFFKKLFYNFIFFQFINEFFSFKKYHKLVTIVKIEKKLFIMGQFQSEKYFIKNKNKIIKEIYLPAPKKKFFLNKKEEIINNKNAVAIGLRFFEDTPKKSLYTLGGFVELQFYNNALKKILSKIKNPKFYFFSTNLQNIKKLLNNVPEFYKYKIDFVTPQLGFDGNFENLWLLSHFKNFIISNSSYYWWGAYLSNQRFSKNFVISSKKFPNKDTNLKNWILVND